MLILFYWLLGLLMLVLGPWSITGDCGQPLMVSGQPHAFQGAWMMMARTMQSQRIAASA